MTIKGIITKLQNDIDNGQLQYRHYGIRFDDYDYESGEHCNPSKHWDYNDGRNLDEAITNDADIVQMAGTYSWCILRDEEMVSVDVDRLQREVDRQAAGYHVYLIASDERDATVTPNEHIGGADEEILIDAVVIDRIN